MNEQLIQLMVDAENYREEQHYWECRMAWNNDSLPGGCLVWNMAELLIGAQKLRQRWEIYDRLQSMKEVYQFFIDIFSEHGYEATQKDIYTIISVYEATIDGDDSEVLYETIEEIVDAVRQLSGLTPLIENAPNAPNVLVTIQ